MSRFLYEMFSVRFHVGRVSAVKSFCSLVFHFQTYSHKKRAAAIVEASLKKHCSNLVVLGKGWRSIIKVYLQGCEEELFQIRGLLMGSFLTAEVVES